MLFARCGLDKTGNIIKQDIRPFHTLFFSYLKGGPLGTKRISQILSSKLHSSLILHPHDPILVLKSISMKINFWNLTPYFRFGGIPGFRKNVDFEKLFPQNLSPLPFLNIFDGTGLKTTRKQSTRNCRSLIQQFLT